MTDALQQSAQQLESLLATCKTVHSARAVDQALDRMAAEIERDYRARNPLLLCVMNGGLFVTAQLCRRLQFPLLLDYMQVSRYRNTTTGGTFEWRVRPATELKNRPVLIVDDILDEGVTLQEIVAYCRAQGATDVKVAVLTRKQHDRCVKGIGADYIGLDVPDEYIFGCGMDYKGYFRNLNAIYALPED
jgi:hypoxanthine phosphoribosyltransferase